MFNLGGRRDILGEFAVDKTSEVGIHSEATKPD